MRYFVEREEQVQFELTAASVNSTLKTIINIFESLGISKMKELVDPSLEEINSQIKDMREAIDEYEELLQNQNTTSNKTMALMFLQNIKQGILFAENLLISIEDENLESCLNHIKHMNRLNITSPTWE